MYNMYVEVDKLRSVLANYVEVKINKENPWFVITGGSDCFEIPEGHNKVVFTCSLKKRTVEFDAKSDVKIKISWTLLGTPEAELTEL